ncbi:uncharacterized protein V1516DRAFT_665009 [Lipomyces oligophaga]|uniref:uncharacterized protein n=1 Tax=Lipomyces oligophaga TaxID=45792 RepID=UPI0034CDEC2D
MAFPTVVTTSAVVGSNSSANNQTSSVQSPPSFNHFHSSNHNVTVDQLHQHPDTETSPRRRSSESYEGLESRLTVSDRLADREIDALVARISARHEVSGFIVVDLENGAIVKSSMVSPNGDIIWGSKKHERSQVQDQEQEGDLVTSYARMIVKFVNSAREVSSHFFEESDPMKLLRLRTKLHELMIVPGM